MELKPVAHQSENIKCHKWIAVGDIYLDFRLMDYDRYNFNDLYILHNSCDYDGVFCVYRPRRNSVGEWAKADVIGFFKNYKKLLTFIDLRAPFIILKTDERVCVKGKLKQKVFIFLARHRGVLALPMTASFLWSDPSMFVIISNVSLSLRLAEPAGLSALKQ